MTIPDPVAAKSTLRMFVRTRRKLLARACPGAGDQAAAIGLPVLAEAFPDPAGKVAALYQPAGSEIDPRPLADGLAAAGWTLALPSVEGAAGAMVFRRWDRSVPLVRDAAGQAAPDPGQPVVEPDLVVVPLLAFDRSGRRLGQGGGYYDRALEALRARRAVLVLGLAYGGQDTAGLPNEPHDQALDAILTENAYIAVNDWDPKGVW